jgi:hypothetical protein
MKGIVKNPHQVGIERIYECMRSGLGGNEVRYDEELAKLVDEFGVARRTTAGFACMIERAAAGALAHSSSTGADRGSVASRSRQPDLFGALFFTRRRTPSVPALRVNSIPASSNAFMMRATVSGVPVNGPSTGSLRNIVTAATPDASARSMTRQRNKLRAALSWRVEMVPMKRISTRCNAINYLSLQGM